MSTEKKSPFSTLRGKLSPRSTEEKYAAAVNGLSNDYKHYKKIFLGDQKALYMSYCADPNGDDTAIKATSNQGDISKMSALEMVRDALLRSLNLADERVIVKNEDKTKSMGTLNLTERLAAEKQKIREDYIQSGDLTPVINFRKGNKGAFSEQEKANLKEERKKILEVTVRDKQIVKARFMESGDPSILTNFDPHIRSTAFSNDERNQLHNLRSTNENLQPSFRDAAIENSLQSLLTKFLKLQATVYGAKLNVDEVKKQITLSGLSGDFAITVKRDPKAEGGWSITATNPAEKDTKEKVSVLLFNLQTELESLGVKGVKVSEDLSLPTQPKPDSPMGSPREPQ